MKDLGKETRAAITAGHRLAQRAADKESKRVSFVYAERDKTEARIILTALPARVRLFVMKGRKIIEVMTDAPEDPVGSDEASLTRKAKIVFDRCTAALLEPRVEQVDGKNRIVLPTKANYDPLPPKPEDESEFDWDTMNTVRRAIVRNLKGREQLLSERSQLLLEPADKLARIAATRILTNIPKAAKESAKMRKPTAPVMALNEATNFVCPDGRQGEVPDPQWLIGSALIIFTACQEAQLSPLILDRLCTGTKLSNGDEYEIAVPIPAVSVV